MAKQSHEACQLRSHGRLQFIIMQLLEEAGLFAASEVELRFQEGEEARPRPDIVASERPFTEQYLTKPVKVVVEILSENDSHSYLEEKCRYYESCGFRMIYAVDLSDRSVVLWDRTHFVPAVQIYEKPTGEIWRRLARSVQLT